MVLKYARTGRDLPRHLSTGYVRWLIDIRLIERRPEAGGRGRRDLRRARSTRTSNSSSTSSRASWRSHSLQTPSVRNCDRRDDKMDQSRFDPASGGSEDRGWAKVYVRGTTKRHGRRDPPARCAMK